MKFVDDRTHITDEINNSNTNKNVMTAIVDAEICKFFTYSNNKLEKSSRVTKSEYSAIAVPAELSTVLSACEHGQVTLVSGSLVGSVENDGIKLLSRKKYAAQFGQNSEPMLHRDPDGKWVGTRTKDNFVYAPILLIDHDVNEATPEIFKDITPDDLLRLLAKIMLGFANAAHVLNYGSSAGLIAPDGTPLTGLCSFHLFFKVKNCDDIPRFKEVLAARCILAGMFWHRSFADGRKTVETIFDLKAIGRERLIYETLPTLKDGLTRQTLQPVHHIGEELDTELLHDLTEVEWQDLATITETPITLVSRHRPGSSIVGVSRSEGELTLETEIVLADGAKTTVQAFRDSGQVKLPCFAPFREDRSPSAFIARHPEKPDVIFVHDTGRAITHFLKLDDNSKKAVNLPLKGKLSTLETMAELLKLHSITARYNLIKKDIQLVVPGYSFSPDNTRNASMAVVDSLAVKSGLAMSGIKIRSYLLTLGDLNRFNPVLEWIRSVPWDGVDRLPALANKLTVDQSQQGYRDIVMRRWSIGAVAAAASEQGEKNEMVLVLSGEQGIGKTTFFRSLAPSEFVLDGHLLNPSDKDSIKLAVSHWLVELGELDATFRKSDIAALKAFLSKDRDELRLPYAPNTSVFPRRSAQKTS
ncbi:MAG: VapE domain-containing protein [Methylococcaceae bacterium]